MRLISLFISISLLSISPVWSNSENLKVSAVYTVTFGSFDLGDFRFTSRVEDNRYRMDGSTKLAILKGLVMDWRMKVHSNGEVTDGDLKPKTFSYAFHNKTKKKKKKKLKLSFASSPQEKMKVEPKPRKSRNRIPITPEHLKNVYDPMSALMLMTHAKDGNLNRSVCNREVRLYDGKERYNISFQYKSIKTTKIGNKKPKRMVSYVCSLRYIPVAGHKKSDKTKKYMSKVDGIEVWFTPSKKLGIYVPHLISIPTPFGSTTTIRARYFGVEKDGGKKIHLIR